MRNEPSIAVPFVDLRRDHVKLASELQDAFDRVLGASAFILGEEVEAFESEFAQRCGARYCVGVNSGTAALTVMLQAAGIGLGDEVIVPAHTFLATALAAVHVGATPVWVDVDAGTGLIDPRAAEAAVNDRTAALIAVHLYGQTCPMRELRQVADRHGLALFEDAAQAHGASYQGRAAGCLGRAAAFSFYPSKNLGALGDGGAICTDDPQLAEDARRLRDLGRGEGAAHTLAGYNERLDGLQAAFLRVKLAHLDGWNEARRLIADRYRAALSDVELLRVAPEGDCVYHVFPVKLEDRDSVAGALSDRGIATGIHYPLALADQPVLARLRSPDPVPVARDWAARELSLPMFPEMTERESDAVIAALRSAVGGQTPADAAGSFSLRSSF
jgi:dTDP-3-amino-3,4,6-trideoxy-alpha-D-glucose transaminase